MSLTNLKKGNSSNNRKLRLVRKWVPGIGNAKYIVNRDNRELIAVVITGTELWAMIAAIILLLIGSALLGYFLYQNDWSLKGLISDWFWGVIAILDEDYDPSLWVALASIPFIIGLFLGVIAFLNNDMYVFDLRDWKFKWYEVYPWKVQLIWEAKLADISDLYFDIERNLIDAEEGTYNYKLKMILPPEAAKNFPKRELYIQLCTSRDEDAIEEFKDKLEEIVDTAERLAEGSPETEDKR